MTEQQMITEHLAKTGATECPPAKADGAKLNPITRERLNAERRRLRAEQQEEV